MATIDSIDLYLGVDVAKAGWNVILHVHDFALYSSYPDTGSLIGSKSIDVSNVPVVGGLGPDWVTFTFDTPITVSSNGFIGIEAYTDSGSAFQNASLRWYEASDFDRPDIGGGYDGTERYLEYWSSSWHSYITKCGAYRLNCTDCTDNYAQVTTGDYITFSEASKQGLRAYLDAAEDPPETIPSINKLCLGVGGDFLLASTNIGIYLSSDLGDTWAQELPDETADTNWLSGVCSSTGTYIIVEAGTDTIYRSANSGSTWAEITPAGSDSFTISDMAMSETGEIVLLVGINTDDATKSCYLSEDYGASWTAIYPVAESIAWEHCDISLDGAVQIVSNSGGDVYVSSDSGATWVVQVIDSTSSTWDCLCVSGDGTFKLVANTANNDEVFRNNSSYSEATWAETAVTSAGRALLDDTTAAAQASTIGVGIEDSPQFTGATISGLTANSLVCPSAGGVLASLGAATNGQLPIGSTGAAPSLAVLTQGTGITVSNSAGSITIASTISQYTNEMAQDSVGGILDDGTVGNIVFTYDDAGGVISAATQDGEIDHDSLSNVHQDVNTDASPTFARLSIDGVGTYIDTDGSNNMTLTDAVVGTRTLKQLGCPTYKYIKVTAQAEGDLHLSDGTYWAISKSLIKYIRVVTDSTAWDLYILQNDNGYVANDATIPRMKIGDNVIGNATLWLDLPYEDEDASEEVHLYWVDNSGTNTATFIIQAIELL